MGFSRFLFVRAWVWALFPVALALGCSDPQFLASVTTDAEVDAGEDVSMVDAGDAGAADAASPDGEATEAATDGGDELVEDASAPDAVYVFPPEPCHDDSAVLGAECPGVVSCTSAGLCDLREKRCCVSTVTADCSPQPSCGAAQSLRCDGPEDCAAGLVCCQHEGSTRCIAKAECIESERACHTDNDCDRNRCLEGYPGLGGTVLFFRGAGVCRGL